MCTADLRSREKYPKIRTAIPFGHPQRYRPTISKYSSRNMGLSRALARFCGLPICA
jgi:hypothetical protein